MLTSLLSLIKHKAVSHPTVGRRTSRLQQATRTLQCDLVVGQELVNAVKEENEREDTTNLLERLHPHGDLAIRGRTQAVRIWTLTLAPTTT